MKWGENRNYRKNPCLGCTKERMKKVDGKYIRCDMGCVEYKEWNVSKEADRKKKINNIMIADTSRQLEHKRCTTRRRKAV